MARPSVERSVGSQPEGSNFRQPSASGGLDREHAGEATRDELARDLVIHLDEPKLIAGTERDDLADCPVRDHRDEHCGVVRFAVGHDE